MGYACPVCGTPQADGEHLADHLAITAIARGGDHEAWLDEHVADWADRDAAALAELVVEHAPDADYPQVFEDTTADGLDPADVERLAADADLDADAAEIVERARELTRRRRADSETE